MAAGKSTILKIAHHFGVTVLPLWRMEAYPFARFLQRLFDLYAIDCVVDVGANRGQYRDFLRLQVGYDGDIVSYEPDPECVQDLRDRAKLDARWQVVPMALGSKPGELPFQIMADSRFNSFLTPDHDGVDLATNRIVREETVRVATFDDQARLHGFAARNTYLKLDTQGYDLEVLRGGIDSLPMVRALQTELSVRHIYHGMADFDQVLRFLDEEGFAVSNMFPVTLDDGLRAIELDCVLVNSRFCDRSKAARPESSA